MMFDIRDLFEQARPKDMPSAEKIRRVLQDIREAQHDGPRSGILNADELEEQIQAHDS